jgi:hypothetical protein
MFEYKITLGGMIDKLFTDADPKPKPNVTYWCPP